MTATTRPSGIFRASSAPTRMDSASAAETARVIGTAQMRPFSSRISRTTRK
jgi:hypothetical protein